MPPLKLGFLVTTAPSNPLGVKGGSETGTIGPRAVIANAVVDALWHLGVRHIKLPLTPHSVWRAVQAATKDGTCAPDHNDGQRTNCHGGSRTTLVRQFALPIIEYKS
jgi:hypothetical protein